MECDKELGDCLWMIADFNSRTHVECDCKQGHKHDSRTISTHALTWSATNSESENEIAITDFNSRTHVECDDVWLFPGRHADISTHALTWSATRTILS